MFRDPGVAARMDDEIPVHGEPHASSSHEASSEPIFKRREDLGEHSVYTHFHKVSTVFILISLKTEIARSVKGPKLQGPHAEDTMVELYFVLKILVT